MTGKSHWEGSGSDDPACGESEEDVHQGARRAAGAERDTHAEREVVWI